MFSSIFKRSVHISNRMYSSNTNKIFQIVLTGGPCGGKSTALTQVSSRLNQLGYQSFIIPEIPTMFNQCGAGFNPLMEINELLTYEANVIKTQIAIEDSFTNIAKASQKPTVILCDRGTLDVAAYLKTNEWNLLLDMQNWNVSSLRDKRYDAVFHLVTAAIGAEKFYTCGNNIARRETPEEAINLDYAIRKAWIGHPSIKIITNESDFKYKVSKLVDGVLGVIGLPKPKHVERRWLIPYEIAKQVWDFTFNEQNKYFQEFESITHYLLPENTSSNISLQSQITKRSKYGENTYFYTERYDDPTDPSMVNITANRISTKNYLHLLSKVDSSRSPVEKTMRFFVHNDLYFTLNKYKTSSINETYVLEVEDDSNNSLQELLSSNIVDASGIEELSENCYTTEEFSKMK